MSSPFRPENANDYPERHLYPFLLGLFGLEPLAKRLCPGLSVVCPQFGAAASNAPDAHYCFSFSNVCMRLNLFPAALISTAELKEPVMEKLNPREMSKANVYLCLSLKNLRI